MSSECPNSVQQSDLPAGLNSTGKGHREWGGWPSDLTGEGCQLLCKVGKDGLLSKGQSLSEFLPRPSPEMEHPKGPCWVQLADPSAGLKHGSVVSLGSALPRLVL